mgnify:CR=1
MQELVDKVVQWASDRNLIEGSTPEKQFLKTVEEMGEVANALGKNDLPELMDGIGDVTVTLIIMAAQLGVKFEDCLALAYDEIRHRKGRMENGLFVKEA